MGRRADAGHARGFAYWLVQADLAPRDDVQVVIDWIKTEAEAVELRLEGERKSALSTAGLSLDLAEPPLAR